MNIAQKITTMMPNGILAIKPAKPHINTMRIMSRNGTSIPINMT